MFVSQSRSIGAIKTWTILTKDKDITKDQAENMYKYIRELKHFDFRTSKFWIDIPASQTFTFEDLQQWAGLDLPKDCKNKPWWEILKRNFQPKQVTYFVQLLKNYGQKVLNSKPEIIIDTIHSVKGGEANHVCIYSKTNYPAAFSHKNKDEKSDEKRVYYTGVTRAKKSLHIFSTDRLMSIVTGKQ